ncbi:MAG TPA: YceH family protein [Bryobacteraceae bacterium]|nr:YceH family protein [Bryobacteraceae bacterium]
MIELDPIEARALGCLIEKEITTPEYYPMTLNALLNACNQKSNRDPVVTYEEEDLADALDRLRGKQLLTTLTGGGNRVPKYGHRLQERLNLGRREIALLCELLLRGPQTLGELKDRAGRMHRFSDTDEVERCLTGMDFVKALPRQPGTKEPRWAQLLSGEPPVIAYAHEQAAHASAERSDRVTQLEAEVAELRQRLDDLERQMIRVNQLFS